MTKASSYAATRLIGIALALVLAVGWSIAIPAYAGDTPVSKKLKRKIKIMEKVVDEVLVESPNLLVYSGNPTHGIYLDEFGTVFTFEAALVDKDWDWAFDKTLGFLSKLRVESDGDKVIVWRDKKSRDSDEDDEEDTEAIDEKTLDEMRKDKEQREEKLYAQGKEELIEAIVDYGEILTELRDDQWVAIAAFLKNSDYFRTNQISRLVIKVKVRDLRDHASGRISEKDLLKRVVQEEY